MAYKNIKNEIAFLSGRMNKGEYLKEDKVDSERFQMTVISRVANDINSFISSMEFLNKEFFADQQQNGLPGQACSPYGCSDRFKDITSEEKNKVKEMVYELLKDKVKLIDASIDKIFKGKEMDDEDDEEEDEENESEE